MNVVVSGQRWLGRSASCKTISVCFLVITFYRSIGSNNLPYLNDGYYYARCYYYIVLSFEFSNHITDSPNSLLYIITFKVQKEKDYLFAPLKIEVYKYMQINNSVSLFMNTISQIIQS